MKTSAYLFTSMLAAIMGLQACTNSADKKQDKVETVNGNNDSIAVIKNGDVEFLKNAALGGMMEVELGKLAQANSLNKRVKNFGSMMVTDHGKANDQLKALALSKNVVLPGNLDEDHQKHIDHLKDRKGPAFDLTYINIMVKDHRTDVKKFKDAGKDASDPDVRAFALETLPVLQKHLDSAKAIHKVLKPALDNIIIP